MKKNLDKRISPFYVTGNIVPTHNKSPLLLIVSTWIAREKPGYGWDSHLYLGRMDPIWWLEMSFWSTVPELFIDRMYGRTGGLLRNDFQRKEVNERVVGRSGW